MIDPLPTPLERILGPQVGRYLADLYSEHGVELQMGTRVFRGDPNDGPFVVFYLSSGQKVAGANVNAPGMNTYVQALIRAGGIAEANVLGNLDIDPVAWVLAPASGPAPS